MNTDPKIPEYITSVITDSPGSHFDEEFDLILEVWVEAGYTLHSWNLQVAWDYGNHRLSKTIVAVFRHQP